MFNFKNPRVIIMNEDLYYIAGMREFLKHYFPDVQIVSTISSLKELRYAVDTVPFDIVISSIYGNDSDKDNFFSFYNSLGKACIDKGFIITTGNNLVASQVLGYGPVCISKKESLYNITQTLMRPAISWPRYFRSSTLTLREIEILTFFYKSISPNDISKITGTSIKTISNQKKSAMRKLHLKDNMMLLKFLRNI